MEGGFTNSRFHTRIAPKEQAGFSTYERLYQRPFVYADDLFLETQTLRNYTMVNGQSQ